MQEWAAHIPTWIKMVTPTVMQIRMELGKDFAPGGVAEMTLISLALGIDVAFVSTHHLVRVVFMVTAAPLIFHFINKKWGLKEDPKDHKI